MFKHQITYKDFNSVEHTEDLYFHLSSPEMLDLQYNPQVEGDFGKFITEGLQGGEGRKLWIIFKLLIVNSYGRRSADGAQFIKKAEWTEEFINSPAFEKFFEWLLLDSPDGKHGKEFYNAIMPERVRGELDKLESGEGDDKRKKITEYTHEELVKMLQEKTAGPKVIDG